MKWSLHVELSLESQKAIISWSTGHMKLPQQIALTKYNRQVSAIVRVPIVKAENLFHFEEYKSLASEEVICRQRHQEHALGKTAPSNV